MRLRRAHRRAERGKIDADQRPRRREGVDRHPQGADDPLGRARRPDQGRGADRVRRHARPVRAQAPPRPGDGRLGLGRGRRRRRARAPDRRQEGGGRGHAERGNSGDPRWAPRRPQAEARRPQQDRSRRSAEAARARGEAQRGAGVRRHVHDQRVDRRRARPAHGAPDRAYSAADPGSIPRTRSRRRRSARSRPRSPARS